MSRSSEEASHPGCGDSFWVLDSCLCSVLAEDCVSPSLVVDSWMRISWDEDSSNLSEAGDYGTLASGEEGFWSSFWEGGCVSLSCARGCGSPASCMDCGCPSLRTGCGSILVVDCGKVFWGADFSNSSLGLDS